MAWDVIRGRKRIQEAAAKAVEWQNTLKAKELRNVELTLAEVKLTTNEAVTLALSLLEARKASWRAIAGTAVLTIGFLCLTISRCLESHSEVPTNSAPGVAFPLYFR
jgi:hypothetical protein